MQLSKKRRLNKEEPSISESQHNTGTDTDNSSPQAAAEKDVQRQDATEVSPKSFKDLVRRLLYLENSA